MKQRVSEKVVAIGVDWLKATYRAPIYGYFVRNTSVKWFAAVRKKGFSDTFITLQPHLTEAKPPKQSVAYYTVDLPLT